MKRALLGMCLLLPLLVVSERAAAVEPDPVVTLSSPASVAAGATIPLSGTVTRPDGSPYVGVQVTLFVRCLDPSGPASNLTPTTDGTGAYDTSFAAGACNRYTLQALYQDPSTWRSGLAYGQVEVLRAPVTAEVSASPLTVRPFEEVTVKVRLTESGGVPLTGAAITLVRQSVEHADKSFPLVTDSQGRATFTDAIPAGGGYVYEARFAGTVQHANATDSTPEVIVSRYATSLTIDGPTTATIDVPFTVTGQLTGPPLPAPVEVWAPGEAISQHVMTDASGRFEATVTSEIGGDVGVGARYEQSDLYEQADAGHLMSIPKLAPVITVDQASVSTEVGGTVTLTGSVSTVGIGHAAELYVAGAPVPGGSFGQLSSGTFAFTFKTAAIAPGTYLLTLGLVGEPRYLATQVQVPVALSGRTLALTLKAPDTIEVGSGLRASGTFSGLMTPMKDVGLSVGVTQNGTSIGGVVTLTADGFSLYENGTGGGDLVITISVGGPGTVYAKRTWSRIVHQKLRPRLVTKAVAPRARDGRISYFRRTDDPLFATTTGAAFRDNCHRYRVQRVIGGSWTTIRSSACVPLPRLGDTTHWRWRAAPRVGVTYRVFAESPATNRTFRGTSAPRYFRFR